MAMPMSYRAIRQPRSLDPRKAIQQGARLHREGKLHDAERLYSAVLKERPDHFDALHLLGVLHGQRGHHEAAIDLISRALNRNPRSTEAHTNMGFTLACLRRYDDAIESFDEALAINPNYLEALRRRGNALTSLNRFDEAIASYSMALAIAPDCVETLKNRGIAYSKANRFDDAIASFDQALDVSPNDVEALMHRANALIRVLNADEAIVNYEKVLKLNRDHPEALNNRGVALATLKRHDEALASWDKALAAQPDYVEAHHNRACALLELHRFREAARGFGEVLRLKPDHIHALINRGSILFRLKRYDESLSSFERALAINPESVYLPGRVEHAKGHVCDWRNYDLTVQELLGGIRAGKPVTLPFCLLSMSDSPQDQLKSATIFCSRSNLISNESSKASESPPPKPVRRHHDRIRLAYLSADFHEHPTAHLMAGLFERHDRSKFEIAAISFDRPSQGPTRSRLVNSFERFIDVHKKSDSEVAALLRESGFGIAVDLKGFTTDARVGILARRPAPIQVNYLGYPGTTGADFIDYIVADEFIIPRDQFVHYTEKIVSLPGCYQVNDRDRKISDLIPTRREVGLPERAFVFCCFNNTYKIKPQVFDVWMRLLAKVDQSVLWLYTTNATAVKNLRREAAARRIDPSRLVFAPRVKLEYHLSRHRIADLFLDTLPCNAHTTASDALWAGLPVLTCSGRTFASRVAGSLLHAVGLPDLVTHTLDDYEALALKLATDANLLCEVKDRLARNRLTEPLFDTDRFRRHIEAAYMTMWEIHQRGENPQSFAVPPFDQSQ